MSRSLNKRKPQLKDRSPGEATAETRSDQKKTKLLKRRTQVEEETVQRGRTCSVQGRAAAATKEKVKKSSRDNCPNPGADGR